MIFRRVFHLLCWVTTLFMYCNATQETSDPFAKRQVISQTPIMSPNVGGILGGLLPAILPVIFMLGIGAFLLPVIGILLFGSSGGPGGPFDGFGMKRSFSFKDNLLFSPEKMIELLQTVTKAIEEASKKP